MDLEPCLPSELTIYTVGELHPQWLRWLAEVPEAERFSVQAGAVAEVDAAGLQMLLALQRSLAARQQGLSLVEPSRTLLAACRALGLATVLGCDGPAGASA
jgi:ABC-type transporter Mla MlaB component